VSYRLVFDDALEEDLSGLPRVVQDRLLAKLAALAGEPRPGFAKAMTGELRGYWSLRVGDYRAAYTIDDHERAVHVWNAGHRSRFYERLLRRRRG
jgi:mRNA interferase RelE/StbE